MSLQKKNVRVEKNCFIHSIKNDCHINITNINTRQYQEKLFFIFKLLIENFHVQKIICTATTSSTQKAEREPLKKFLCVVVCYFNRENSFYGKGEMLGSAGMRAIIYLKPRCLHFFFVLNNIFYMKFNLIMQCRFRNILNGWFFFGEKLFRLWFTTINFISPLKIYRFFVLCAGSFRLLGSCCNLTMWTERYMTEGKQNLISARHILHFVKKTSNVKAPWII